MEKETFVTKAKCAEWSMMNKLESRVVQMFYGIGENFDLDEIDIKPGEGKMLVYGHFNKVWTLSRFIPAHSGGNVCEWMEIYIDTLPASVPDPFALEAGRIEEEFDVRIVTKSGFAVVGCNLGEVHGHEDLKNTLVHLLDHRQRLKDLLNGKENGHFAQDGVCQQASGTEKTGEMLQ